MFVWTVQFFVEGEGEAARVWPNPSQQQKLLYAFILSTPPTVHKYLKKKIIGLILGAIETLFNPRAINCKRKVSFNFPVIVNVDALGTYNYLYLGLLS